MDYDMNTEFQAETHFNLHIEGAASVRLYKRTSGEGWDFVTDLVGLVIDEDVFVDLKKQYRIECSVLPSVAVATFADGKVLNLI